MIAQTWKWIIAKNNTSVFVKCLQVVLSFCSLIYKIVVRLRNTAYDRGWFEIKKADVPVISIGNLSVGGSGKTALTLWCAEVLQKNSKKPAILSRGYRRKSSEKEIKIVSDGVQIFEDAASAGDEPLLMAKKMKGTAVVIGSDRYQAAQHALAQLDADCFLLDDGFQHRRLYRTWDIVALDDSILNAPYLFPRGVLREPIQSLKRANFIVVKTEKSDQDFLNRFQTLFDFQITVPCAFFNYSPSALIENQTRKILPVHWLKGKKVMTCSAIAHPEHFENLLKDQGAQIEESIRFQDHHYFSNPELERLKKKASQFNCTIVTTEKDAVKMPADFPVLILAVQIHWQRGEDELKREILKTANSE